MGLRFSNSAPFDIKVLQRLRNAQTKLYTLCVRRHFQRLDSNLPPHVEITNPQFISIGRGVHLRPGIWLYAITGYRLSPDGYKPTLEIGDGCSIGRFCHITCSNRVVIGDRVLLAEGVYIADNSHPYEDPNVPVIAQGLLSSGPVVIGSGTWVGNGARIMGKVKIGRNCVIGTNCVLKDAEIPDHCVVVGAPARIIRRYDPVPKMWRRTGPQGDIIETQQAERPS